MQVLVRRTALFHHLGHLGKDIHTYSYNEDFNLERLEIALNFGSETVLVDGFQLFQNRPNPFVKETVIGFSLPNQMDATITIFDGTCRLVQRIDGNLNSGYNEVVFENEGKRLSGLLYYTHETKAFTATRKMFLVE